MKKTLISALLVSTATGLAAPVLADVNIGLVGGITGATSGLAPEMFKAYDLAVAQVNAQGGMLDGQTLVGVVADDGCNAQTGVDAVTKAVNVSGAIALAGPWCSGVVLAVANAVAIPAGVMLVTPAGTSPAITTLDDKGLVFRTVPSDEYQGQVLARTMLERGVSTIAVAYINNDYGKGFADAFRKEYEAQGGTIAGFAGHEEGRASYRADLAALAAEGADTLLLIDLGDTSGLTILRESIENDFFQTYVGGEGMKSAQTISAIGAENLQNFFVSSPVSAESESLTRFSEDFKAAGGDPAAVFTSTSYDAVFMLALAAEAANGDKAAMPAAFVALTDGTGEAILPGEWAKAKALIAAGTAIEYKGASGSLSFDAAGDVPGAYALFKVGASDYEFVSDMK